MQCQNANQPVVFISLIYSVSFPEECKLRIRETACPEKCWEVNHDVSSDPENDTEYINDMKTTGWFAVWHCIQPFLGTFLVFLSMNYRKMNRCPEIPEGPDCLKKYGRCCLPFQILWKLGYLLCLLISVVPIPALTNIYMFYLNVRSHHARSQPLFRKEMESIESRIKNYKALGTLERNNSFIS